MLGKFSWNFKVIRNPARNKIQLKKKDLFVSSSEIQIKPLSQSFLNATKNSNQESDFNFVDLFCGAGGITVGLSKAGFFPLLSSDFKKLTKRKKGAPVEDEILHGE